MANQLKGKEVRRVVSVRMEPSQKEMLIKKFGSVQAAVDYLIQNSKKIRAKAKE